MSDPYVGEIRMLPNLQGRLPIHQGSTYIVGQVAGTESVTLTSGQLPSHDHPFNATTNPADKPSPSGALPASGYQMYHVAPSAPTVPMAPQSIGQSAGGSQPHSNMMPYLAVSFIISLYGVYPTQN